MTIQELSVKGLFIGKSISLQKKSIELMLNSITKDESIKITTPCNLVGTTPGVVTLTDKRIIFTSKVLFNSVKRELNIEDVKGFDFLSSFGNKLIITGYNSKIEITAIEKSAGEKIIEIYNRMINTNSTPSSLNISDLEKLSELKDRDLITLDEFDIKKKQILDL